MYCKSFIIYGQHLPIHRSVHLQSFGGRASHILFTFASYCGSLSEEVDQERIKAEVSVRRILKDGVPRRKTVLTARRELLNKENKSQNLIESTQTCSSVSQKNSPEKDTADETELERRAREVVASLAARCSRRKVTSSSITESDEPKENVKCVNRYRRIVYNEGELDSSDLTKPPSRSNPHPFDPSECPEFLPPTHSRSLVQYANHLPVLQNLVILGVDLFEIDSTTMLGKALVRLDWERDVRPKLEWLIKLGLNLQELGSYLTRNPFFLVQNLNSMKARVNYLLSKRFKPKEVVKVVTEFRYWLNTDVRTIDGRLGWIQKSFGLSGNEIRQLIVKEPRIVMFGIAPLERILNALTKEMEFTKNEIKSMLLRDPRLFMIDVRHLTSSYDYLHFTMGLSNSTIAKFPLAMRCSVSAIRRRHEFLKKLGRAQYDSSSPDCVSLPSLLHPSDKFFVTSIAKSYVVVYNEYLRKFQ
ncbi:hypothetical protein AB6A40_007409 [Gnathostoma spinigerum]|uniref:Uncharacterized protein n=1 Tax=Gnathostoma spinigerum TaxID=75299 RepID=A0ABD6EWR2_9BILA